MQLRIIAASTKTEPAREAATMGALMFGMVAGGWVVTIDPTSIPVLITQLQNYLLDPKAPTERRQGENVFPLPTR